MSRQELKSKIRENATAYLVIALLSGGSGSAVSSLGGGGEVKELSDKVAGLTVQIGKIETKLDFLIPEFNDKRHATSGSNRTATR